MGKFPVPSDALSFDTSTSSVHRCAQLPLVVGVVTELCRSRSVL
ncbi:hypothetical protein [Nostoc sp.]